MGTYKLNNILKSSKYLQWLSNETMFAEAMAHNVMNKINSHSEQV